jgi:EmrB/QacA subfamily drug resistance transporter
MAVTDRRRWIALYVLCVGMLMIVLDVTVVNVALPSIKHDLRFSQSSLAWVVNAYLISFGGLLLLAGRFGDLFGRRRVFLVGLAVFVGASVACGFAESQGVLVVARFVQGVGGAMTSAVILGMIVTMFPDPRDQAKAIGTYGFVASAGGSIGLLAGGVLTQAINWHWIFFINVPIGLLTAVFARRLLPADEDMPGFAGGTDVLGAVLITSSLMLGVYTIVKPAAQRGWLAPVTLALGGATLALLAAFIVREARARNPLIPLRIFRSRNVSGANVVQVLTVPGMFGMFFLGSLYLQQLKYDPLEIGLAFLPLTVIMGTLSVRFTEPLVTRFGARATLLPGLALVVGGLLLFARAPLDATYVLDVLPVMVLMGVGIGLAFPALLTLAMSGATPADAGLASGLVNATAQVGGALGLAVLATLSSTHAHGGSPAALVSGYHLAFVVGAGLVACAFAVAATVLRAAPAPHPEFAAAEPVADAA